MKNTTKLMAVVAAAAVVAGGAFVTAGAVSAQQPTPPASTQRQQTRGQNFLEKLAGNLGITLDQLKQGVSKTELQVVDQMVASGKLTADQAQKLKDKINGGNLNLGKFIGARQASARLARLRAGIVKSAATAIGIKPADLRQELRDGKSIADVAAEHSVSLDTVKSQITSDAQAKLSQAVKNGKITQAQADLLLQKLTSKLDDIVNRKKS